jgi:hypothetical protein
MYLFQEGEIAMDDCCNRVLVLPLHVDGVVSAFNREDKSLLNVIAPCSEVPLVGIIQF